MDEVKNMLDYKVGHHIKYDDIPPTYVLRSFMFIKQNFYPFGDMDELKVVDCRWQSTKSSSI